MSHFVVYEVGVDRAMRPKAVDPMSPFRFAIMETIPAEGVGPDTLTKCIAWCCNKGEAEWVSDMLNGPGVTHVEHAIDLLKRNCKNLDIDNEGHEGPPKGCGCEICRIRKLLGGEL